MAGTVTTTAEEEAPARATRFKGITRPVWILGLVSFFADLSGEMVYPIIPLFITETLGAPALALGLVEGIAEGTANVTKLFSGRWADIAQRRKPFVVGGYSLGTLGKGILVLAPAWPVALLGRSVDRFGKGLRTAPRDAMLADFSEPRYRGRVFGFHRSMDTLGAIGGPLVALALLALLEDKLRLVIAVSLIPGVAAIFVLRWLPERRGHVASGAQASIGLRGLPTRFYVLLGITLVFMVGNSSDAFLILRSKDLGLTTTLVVLAYVAYNVVYAALSYPAGVISDRLPRSWVLATGWAVFAVVYAGFALTNSSGAVWPLFLVYGGYIALTDGVSKALVADIVPEAVRSSALGLYQGLAGLAALSASIMAGLMWDYVSESAPFVLGGVCALAAAVALVIVTMGGIFSEKQPATAVAG